MENNTNTDSQTSIPDGYSIRSATVTDSYTGQQNTAWRVAKKDDDGYKFAQRFWSEEDAIKAIEEDVRMDARIAAITPEQEAAWQKEQDRQQAIEDFDEDNQ